MEYRTAKWIFILGTATSLVLFLFLTVDTHRQVAALTNADKLDDAVVEGKRVFEKRNCNDCHTILGFGAYYAPDLTRVYKRLGDQGLRAILKNPDQAFKNSFRKMPQQNLTDEEISNLVSFFKWINEINTNEWPPQDHGRSPGSSETRRLVGGQLMSEGAALFKSQGCGACHKIGGVGGDSGPALDEIGEKRDADNIAKFIRNPRAEFPNTVMPPQTQLTDEQALAIGKFLSDLEEERED